MANPNLRKIVKVVFFIVVAAAVLGQFASVYARWQSGRRIRAEIRAGARVAVLKADPRFPPSLLLSFENGSRYAIEQTTFRLTLSLGGRLIAATERDFREMRPGQKEHVLLESVAVPPSTKPPGPGTRLEYRLLVFPDKRKPLPEITGEIEIR